MHSICASVVISETKKMTGQWIKPNSRNHLKRRSNALSPPFGQRTARLHCRSEGINAPRHNHSKNKPPTAAKNPIITHQIIAATSQHPMYPAANLF